MTLLINLLIAIYVMGLILHLYRWSVFVTKNRRISQGMLVAAILWPLFLPIGLLLWHFWGKNNIDKIKERMDTEV